MSDGWLIVLPASESAVLARLRLWPGVCVLTNDDGIHVAGKQLEDAQQQALLGLPTLDRFLVQDDGLLFRPEELFVYEIKNRERFEFVARHSLSSIFSTGKRIGAGRKRHVGEARRAPRLPGLDRCRGAAVPVVELESYPPALDGPADR